MAHTEVGALAGSGEVPGISSGLPGAVQVHAPVLMARRRQLLGLPVDALTMGEVVEVVAGAIARKSAFRIVVTNANKTWLASRDPVLRSALEGADLVVAEWATAWAASRLGVPGIVHIGGITLMMRLIDECEARGWSCYFLGARSEVSAALLSKLSRERPALRVAGAHHGYLDEALSKDVRAELVRLRPDIVFVGMGSPLQEQWLVDLPGDAGVVRLGVGGSFDVLAGLKQDAPAWLRGRGGEWLWRLAQDPRRLWKRYLVTNTWFVGQVLRARLARRERAL